MIHFPFLMIAAFASWLVVGALAILRRHRNREDKRDGNRFAFRWTRVRALLAISVLGAVLRSTEYLLDADWSHPSSQEALARAIAATLQGFTLTFCVVSILRAAVDLVDAFRPDR